MFDMPGKNLNTSGILLLEKHSIFFDRDKSASDKPKTDPTASPSGFLCVRIKIFLLDFIKSIACCILSEYYVSV